MPYIELTKCEFALVDDEDYAELSQHRWYAQTTKGGFYAARRDHNGAFKYLHRVIMNEPEGMVVDHINGNTLDNRRSNLRICTQSQNTKNRIGYRKATASGHKGITWCKDTNKWRAQLKIDYKNRTFGRFENLDDAIKARKEAEEKYFGSFNRESVSI